ncbi:hypothetical protein C8R48DRAFT_354217 [Suillus tomentosus]|nr:hypothetical protein C8R48DRAFT_354217 [Suillus tomentosus]
MAYATTTLERISVARKSSSDTRCVEVRSMFAIRLIYAPENAPGYYTTLQPATAYEESCMVHCKRTVYLGAFRMWFRNSHESKQPGYVAQHSPSAHVDSHADTQYRPLQPPREQMMPLRVKF